MPLELDLGYKQINKIRFVYMVADDAVERRLRKLSGRKMQQESITYRHRYRWADDSPEVRIATALAKGDLSEEEGEQCYKALKYLYDNSEGYNYICR